jgi:hypothetical protein
MHSVVFVRRINPDGSQTSSCPKCLTLVIRSAAQKAIEAAESLHICNLPELSDSLYTPTLAERVLTFLKAHNA